MANEKFRKKILQGKIAEKKSPKTLNESAQIGDKVIYKGQRGFITGQTMNGDWLVQVQGNADFVNPKDIKVVGIKAKTMETPFKFDEKTQKLLFEQYVRCGIFMGNTPVKIQNCYVKYSQWKNAELHENINVMSDGELNIMPKEQVRVFEDPNNFANPDDYSEGTLTTNQGPLPILVNSLDYTAGVGDASLIRIILNPGQEDQMLDSVPKSLISISI